MPERSYCLFHVHILPDRFPVQHRRDLPARRPPVVATRADEELLCGGEHDGAHMWPDGEEVVVPLSASAVEQPLPQPLPDAERGD